jgi:hypothetical protein
MAEEVWYLLITVFFSFITCICHGLIANRYLQSLPESRSLPRVRFCAQSEIKNSRQRILCREFFIWLSAQKKHLANRLVCREPNKKLSAQKETLAIDFFTDSQTKNSRQRKFKKSFFCLQFFSILNVRLNKTYAQIWHNFNFVCYI